MHTIKTDHTFCVFFLLPSLCPREHEISIYFSHNTDVFSEMFIFHTYNCLFISSYYIFTFIKIEIIICIVKYTFLMILHCNTYIHLCSLNHWQWGIYMLRWKLDPQSVGCHHGMTLWKRKINQKHFGQYFARWQKNILLQ